MATDTPLLAGAAASNRNRRLIGWVSLAALILAWVGQAEVAQRIQVRLGYDKPWAVGWLNHGAMALLLPLVWLHDRRAFRKLGASARAVALRCAFLALVYTLADYCWYLGLARTAVSEATALFNAQSVFTYALSVCVLGEKVRARKVLAVLIAVGGVALISFCGGGRGDAPTGGSDRVVGDLIVVAGAFGYAVYEVVFAKVMPADASPSVANAAAGLVGLLSLFVAAPGFVVLDVTRVEPFEWPTEGVWAWLALNAGLALVFNVCLLLCVACLSPLTTSVGCMVTIPLSVLVDFLWHGLEPGWGDAVGAVLVAGGFALLVFEPPSKWSCLCRVWRCWRCCRRSVAAT